MTHAELVERAARWLQNTRGCSTVATRACLWATELPDAIGWKSDGCSILVECKTSRADFFRDKKKHFRQFPHLGVGGLRFYLTPPGLVKEDELPERWGLLECHPKMIRKVCDAKFQIEVNRMEEIRLLLSYVRKGGEMHDCQLDEDCIPDPVI